MKLRDSGQRVWEIDAWRGLLILAVLINHLNMTVNAFCINGYYRIDSAVWASVSDPLGVWYYYDVDGILRSSKWVTTLRELCTNPAVDTFFIISGISCMFSRNNVKRALQVLAAGLFIALFTYGLSVWTGDPTRFIRFGVLMCYASCQLIYAFLLEKQDSEILFLVSAVALAVGYYFRYHGVTPTALPIFYIFGVPQSGDLSSDYWPILPMLGWFLLGVTLGRKYYPEKKSLIHSPMVEKLTRPLQWLGRWSGVIYVGHIVLYTAVFCGIGYLFHLL